MQNEVEGLSYLWIRNNKEAAHKNYITVRFLFTFLQFLKFSKYTFECLFQFLRNEYGGYCSCITWLLDNTRIHVLPTLNPDGYDDSGNDCVGTSGQNNKHNKNLNMNFPGYFRDTSMPASETAAVQKWMSDIPFILSASLYGGGIVAKYPFDNRRDKS